MKGKQKSESTACVSNTWCVARMITEQSLLRPYKHLWPNVMFVQFIKHVECGFDADVSETSLRVQVLLYNETYGDIECR